MVWRKICSEKIPWGKKLGVGKKTGAGKTAIEINEKGKKMPPRAGGGEKKMKNLENI